MTAKMVSTHGRQAATLHESATTYFRRLADLLLRVEVTDRDGGVLSLDDGTNTAAGLIASVRAASGKVLAIGNWASKIHAKMFGIDEESVRQMYFQILSMYKIAFIVLNLVPYLALSFMA